MPIYTRGANAKSTDVSRCGETLGTTVARRLLRTAPIEGTRSELTAATHSSQIQIGLAVQVFSESQHRPPTRKSRSVDSPVTSAPTSFRLSSASQRPPARGTSLGPREAEHDKLADAYHHSKRVKRRQRPRNANSPKDDKESPSG